VGSDPVRSRPTVSHVFRLFLESDNSSSEVIPNRKVGNCFSLLSLAESTRSEEDEPSVWGSISRTLELSISFCSLRREPRDSGSVVSLLLSTMSSSRHTRLVILSGRNTNLLPDRINLINYFCVSFISFFVFFFLYVCVFL